MRTYHQLLLLLVLVVLIIFFSISSPFFFKWDNIKNILDQSTLNIIVGIGLTLVMCAGGIDLSVGAVAALVGAVMAITMHSGFSVPVSVGTGILVGLAIGAGNGGLAALLRVNPFIITLASLSVVRGLTLIITAAIPIYGFPEGFTWWGSGNAAGLPAPVILCALVIVFGAVILNTTKLGYYTLALGGNEEALRRSGVSIKLYKIAVYALSGLTAALAGLILTARLNSADPLAGYMLELDGIATVILGGTSMKGGRGSIAGTVVAGLLLAVLRNGLTIHGIVSYYQQLVTGVIIIASVIIAEIRSRCV